MKVKQEKQSVLMEIIKRFRDDLKKMIESLAAVMKDFFSADEQDPSLEEVLNDSGMTQQEIDDVLKSLENVNIYEKETIEIKKDKKRKKEKEEEEKKKLQELNMNMLNNEQKNKIETTFEQNENDLDDRTR